VKTITKTMPDSYFELVKRFPLARIHDGDHLAEALAVIDRLLREHRDAGAEAYLDVLTVLVEAYEAEHEPMPHAPEADVLRALMEANRLSQNALAKRVGIAQSTLSAVLTGVRSLTKGQVVKLAEYFGVSPAAFLPATAGRDGR
jgi:HTH-type transcriptional regulator/antitoxin HigA